VLGPAAQIGRAVRWLTLLHLLRLLPLNLQRH
jgi:hypothetical protein